MNSLSSSRVTSSRAASEAGTAMLFAVLFLGIILTVVTVLFTFAQSGAKSLQGFRTDRTLRYSADGALEQGIQMVKLNKDLGTGASSATASPFCSLRVPIVEPSTVGTRKTMTSGSFLTVTCSATPGTSSGGLDGDANQLPRDVTFEVICATDGTITSDGLSSCGSGSANRTVARARVRFDVDPGYSPSDAKARVPKIVYWKIFR